jgi:Mg2+ and Co2+ transporter CorA
MEGRNPSGGRGRRVQIDTPQHHGRGIEDDDDGEVGEDAGLDLSEAASTVFSKENGLSVMHFDDPEDDDASLAGLAEMSAEGARLEGSAPDTSVSLRIEVMGEKGKTARSPGPAPFSRRARRQQTREQQRATTHRMKHAAFAQLTARDGDHFMVLEQEGSMVPVLRDFPTLADLTKYLRSLEGHYNALISRESDEDEPSPHHLERSMTRSLYRRRESSSSSSSPGSSGSTSSSSSSTSTMSGLVPVRTMWIDMQCEDQDSIEELLSIFPRLDSDTIDDLLQHDAPDTAHWFHTHRYLFANIDCAVVDVNNTSFTFPAAAATATGFDPSSMGTTVVSLVAFSDVCVTVHQRPYSGHRATLQALHGITSRRRRALTSGHVPTEPRPVAAVHDGDRSHATPAGVKGKTMKAAAKELKSKRRMRLTIGVIVATLIESVVTAMLPDPTACLAEVDKIDEMVLLVSNDSRDLLRRIARVRRILSTHRAALFRKERFLQQFTSPALRSTFISGLNSEQYRHTLGEVYHIAERLESARDVLTQANSNFVSHISLQTSVISNHMNKKMKALSQVATVCLPLNIITGLFGMNVQVPYNAIDYAHTLAPFFTIAACMVAFVLVGIPFMWVTMYEKSEEENELNLGED